MTKHDRLHPLLHHQGHPMNPRTCNCGIPLKDTDEICTGCLRRTSNRLGDLHGLSLELHTAMQRNTKLVEQNDGGKSAEQALYYNEQAATCLHSMRSMLVGWCRLLTEEKGCGYPRNNTIRAMALHLEGHLGLMRTHPAAGDLVDEVHQVIQDATRVIDLPANKMTILVGPCVQTLSDGSPCEGQVKATIPNDETTRPSMACLGCGETWYSEQWSRIGTLILRKKAAA